MNSLTICSFFLNLERLAIVSFGTQMRSLILSRIYLKVRVPEITMTFTCAFRHPLARTLPFRAKNALDLAGWRI